MRSASHCLSIPSLLETVNALTFTFAFLPARDLACQW